MTIQSLRAVVAIPPEHDADSVPARSRARS